MHQHILIEAVSPCVDAGRHHAKALAGQPAVIQWRAKGETRFREAPLVDVGNDRFRGSFPLGAPGLYQFTVEAWTDHYFSWLTDIAKKIAARRPVALDWEDGIRMISAAAARADAPDAAALQDVVAKVRSPLTAEEALAVASSDAVCKLMVRLDQREDAKTYEPLLGIFALPERGLIGAWYEMFPRSETDDVSRPATLRQAERRLPKLAAMGFDVLYLAPVHPIGVTLRKGKNDSEVAGPDEPGCPWAIGGPAGGHTDIEPALGTMEDFDHFVAAARGLGMSIALDFAIQCSPDHPWIAAHPGWFEHRADGSMRCAANPPNEYPDVYRIDFDTSDRVGLYAEMYRVLEFWIERGVTIFRVDNPHTKPVAFWEWLIDRIHGEHPEVILLAEAFTRPKMMNALSKTGFTQSYTYFTWRNTKRELEEYFTELTQSEMRHYFIPNLFANTHDILPEILQKGGPPAFKSRLVLAATLAPSYGIYSGYELCEKEAIPGKEEYWDSEKFEIKARDYDAPGNLNELITTLNRIRRENPALRELCNLKFLRTDDEHIIAYLKSTADRSNVVIVAVNLDPFSAHHATAEIPLGLVGRSGRESFLVKDLLTGAPYTFRDRNFIRLDPGTLPAHIFLVEDGHGPG